MTDIVLRDIDADLAERIRRLGDRHGWPPARTLLYLLQRGLAADGLALPVLDEGENAALARAIAALESEPDDGGFALIGRATPTPPVVEEPDQRVAPEFDLR